MADFSALSHILVTNYHALPAYISFLFKYAIQKSNHERALTSYNTTFRHCKKKLRVHLNKVVMYITGKIHFCPQNARCSFRYQEHNYCIP